jgi:hypothetical protein
MYIELIRVTLHSSVYFHRNYAKNSLLLTFILWLPLLLTRKHMECIYCAVSIETARELVAF